MSRVALRKHKWSLDFTNKQCQDRAVISLAEGPIGYSDKTFSESEQDRSNNPDLIVKKSWDVATGPLKQIPMNLFIMWMAGNSISIFPIMMVGMMFFRPLQALFALQQTFKVIEGGQAIVQRFVYILGNLACLALAVYKCQVMGLLPTQPSDWLAFVQPQERLEWVGGGLSLS